MVAEPMAASATRSGEITQEGGMMAGNPTGEGGKVRAASDAQIADKTFPAGTGAGEVAGVMSSAISADAGWREQSHAGQLMGSPVQPDIRQVTPVADMGMGYREGSEDDPW
jgi:hypothetical protein